MVSTQPLLLIVAAQPRELAGLSGLTRLDLGLRWSAKGSVGGRPAVLVAHGEGRVNAAEATACACDNMRIGGIVSCGYVGALDPELRVGRLFVARTIRRPPDDPDSGPLEYAVVLPEFEHCLGTAIEPAIGDLTTIDHVAQTAEQKRVLRRQGAHAVDMEAYAVAAQAARRGLPLFCVRTVSDQASDDLGLDFNAARRGDGTFSGWKIAAQAGTSPKRWGGLLGLRRDAQLASRNLAQFLNVCRFPLPAQ